MNVTIVFRMIGWLNELHVPKICPEQTQLQNVWFYQISNDKDKQWWIYIHLFRWHDKNRNKSNQTIWIRWFSPVFSFHAASLWMCVRMRFVWDGENKQTKAKNGYTRICRSTYNLSRWPTHTHFWSLIPIKFFDFSYVYTFNLNIYTYIIYIYA